ncbi:MAG: hypothetical protein JWO94_3385, partial [Verrucomicrobiaceae bacterium]|nr:hypothetical protein [Verrucomicrobiaceae bacterium]
MITKPLAELDIIAYGSALETPVRPRVLPPVFRVRQDPSRILMSPFSLVGTEVVNPVIVSAEELEDCILREEVTRLDAPIPAQPFHDLWVNEQGHIAYQPKNEVKRAFKELYDRHLPLARQSLADRRYEDATRHAEIARSANPTHLKPLEILGAIELALHGKDSSQFAFIAHLAKDQIDRAGFEG